MIARPSYLIYQLFNLIMLIMLIRVLLSWFPNFNWYKEPWYSIRKFTDFIFEPFRKVIPPIGMIDISSIFFFFLLSIVQNLLCNFLIGMGL